MSKTLTTELVQMKCRTDNLPMINKLNIWGMDLGDVSLVERMPNLQVLSLSVNKIDTLKPFASLKKLQELYLRNNNIQTLNEVMHLKDLKNLSVLWLSENPVSALPFYREFVVKQLPSLTTLDEKKVTAEERRQALALNLDLPPTPHFPGPEENSPLIRTRPPAASFDDQHRLSRSKQTSHSQQQLSFKDTPIYPLQANRSFEAPAQLSPGPPSFPSSNQYPNQNEAFRKQQQQFEGGRPGGPRSMEEIEEPNQMGMQVGGGGVGIRVNAPASPERQRGRMESGMEGENMSAIQNENILTAILVLMNELTPLEIQILKNECEKKLA